MKGRDSFRTTSMIQRHVSDKEKNMNLTLKRNIPLLILFISFVLVLWLGFGNVPIIFYSG